MGVSIEWIIQTVIMLIIGIIGFFIKQSLSSMDSKINKNNDRIEEVYFQLSENINEKMKSVDDLQKDFQCFKEKVADDYLKKRDFNGPFLELSKKIEKIYDIIIDMKGNTKNG